MFTCSKCGREFSRENNLKWHEESCKGKNKKDPITHKTPINKTNKKEITNMHKEKECKKSKDGSHDLILLRPINPIQLKALRDGYTAYCKNCEELV